jgi:hypothetical protein
MLLSNNKTYLALAAHCSATCCSVCLPFSSCLSKIQFIYQPVLCIIRSFLFSCLTARYAICLPACSCALAQFTCQLARMLYSFLPACLIFNIFCSLSVCLRCNFYDLSASLRRHVTNLHVGSTWFLTSSAVCLPLRFELFASEAVKRRLPFGPACLTDLYSVCLSAC